MSEKAKFAVFAVGVVGEITIKLFQKAKEQLKFVVLHRDNFWGRNPHMIELLSEFPHTKIYYYESDEQLCRLCRGIDAVILAYWGGIVREPLLSVPAWGFINLHTSYLPFGKCKHSHFWALVEGTPYGATVMKIDKGLDTGSIIYQKEVEITWEDTGKSLYVKGILSLKELLEQHRDEVLELQLPLLKQDGEGTFHYGKEIDAKSCIDLDQAYTARELLNLIRARTFAPHPAAYFMEDGETYEVLLQINKVSGSERTPINYEELVQEIFEDKNGKNEWN